MARQGGVRRSDLLRLPQLYWRCLPVCSAPCVSSCRSSCRWFRRVEPFVCSCMLWFRVARFCRGLLAKERLQVMCERLSLFVLSSGVTGGACVQAMYESLSLSCCPQWLTGGACNCGGRNAVHSFRAEPSHSGAGEAEPFLHIFQWILKGVFAVVQQRDKHRCRAATAETSVRLVICR